MQHAHGTKAKQRGWRGDIGAASHGERGFASAVCADVEGGRTDLFQDILFRSQCDGMTDANIHKGDKVARVEGPITFEDGWPTGQTAILASHKRR